MPTDEHGAISAGAEMSPALADRAPPRSAAILEARDGSEGRHPDVRMGKDRAALLRTIARRDDENASMVIACCEVASSSSRWPLLLLLR